MQHLQDIGKTDSNEEFSRGKRAIYSDRKIVFVNLKTDTDKLIFVLYRYLNNSYLKGNEMDVKLTDYQSLLRKWVYLLSNIDNFFLGGAL